MAPDVPPVIFSPLMNVPFTFDNVSVGKLASVLVSSESNTAPKLNASALPKEIVESVALVPNAPDVAPATLTCFDKFVVLILCVIFVFNIVAVNITFAALPKLELSVIVIVDVPVPATLPLIETMSP